MMDLVDPWEESMEIVCMTVQDAQWVELTEIEFTMDLEDLLAGLMALEECRSSSFSIFSCRGPV